MRVIALHRLRLRGETWIVGGIKCSLILLPRVQSVVSSLRTGQVELPRGIGRTGSGPHDTGVVASTCTPRLRRRSHANERGCKERPEMANFVPRCGQGREALSCCAATGSLHRAAAAADPRAEARLVPRPRRKAASPECRSLPPRSACAPGHSGASPAAAHLRGGGARDTSAPAPRGPAPTPASGTALWELLVPHWSRQRHRTTSPRELSGPPSAPSPAAPARPAAPLPTELPPSRRRRSALQLHPLPASPRPAASPQLRPRAARRNAHPAALRLPGTGTGGRCLPPHVGPAGGCGLRALRTPPQPQRPGTSRPPSPAPRSTCCCPPASSGERHAATRGIAPRPVLVPVPVPWTSPPQRCCAGAGRAVPAGAARGCLPFSALTS